MDFVQGTKLSDVCPRLGTRTSSPSSTSSLSSIFSTDDVAVIPRGREPLLYQRPRKVVPGLGVPLEDRRFYGGTDTKLALWYRYGRRTQSDVNRGPCMPLYSSLIHVYTLELSEQPYTIDHSAEALLAAAAAAHKGSLLESLKQSGHSSCLPVEARNGAQLQATSYEFPSSKSQVPSSSHSHPHRYRYRQSASCENLDFERYLNLTNLHVVARPKGP